MTKYTRKEIAEIADRRMRMGYPKQHGKRITLDERCRCGALRSEHEDTAAPGHGAHKKSGCPKFSWAGWVMVGDKRLAYDPI